MFLKILNQRGTEANILQSKSFWKGAWRSTFPLASAKIKSSNYTTVYNVWPNVTSSISTAFIPDNFGDKLGISASVRHNFNRLMLKNFCKELTNKFLFSKLKCNMWPTCFTTATVPSFHGLANLWSALYLSRLPQYYIVSNNLVC